MFQERRPRRLYAEFVEVVGGPLRMAGGAEDRAAVVLENFEPGCDLGRILLARLKGDLQVGAQERGTQLGDQFLGGITGNTQFSMVVYGSYCPAVR